MSARTVTKYVCEARIRYPWRFALGMRISESLYIKIQASHSLPHRCSKL